MALLVILALLMVVVDLRCFLGRILFCHKGSLGMLPLCLRGKMLLFKIKIILHLGSKAILPSFMD